MKNLQGLKKAELVALCEENGLEHEGIKNDDLRAKLAAHYEKNVAACDDCIWYRHDVFLNEHNIPGMPNDKGNVCKYYRSLLLVRPKVCHDYNPGGIGKTADAKINARKRRTIGE